MAPFLRDEGPPVSAETIEDARTSLPAEFGYRVVTENGRKVLLVRSPRAKPDYLHELEDVALYVDLDEVRDVRDVLLVGGQTVCRLEPLRLRDHIRSRIEEDQEAAARLVKTLDRDYGFTFHEHPAEAHRLSVAVRVPHDSVSGFSPDDVRAIRERIGAALRDRIADVTDGYIVADQDFERLGRRVFVELIDPELAAETVPAALVRPEDPYRPAPVAAPTMQANLPRPAIGQHAPARPAQQPRPTAETAHRAPPAPPQAPPAAAADDDGPDEELVTADDHIEVYVRKKPRPEAAPAPQPQEQQAPPQQPPAPPEPQRAPEPMARPMMRASGPSHDNGDVNIAMPRSAETPERTDAIALLVEKMNGRAYEVVAGVSVHGTTFDLAAHRRDGKRLLVKRLDEATAEDVTALDSLARGVGADACLLVADDVAPGTRLASWGTTVEVMDPAEILHMEL